MLEYFKGAIDKVKNLKLNLEPGKKYASKSQFAADIGL